MTSLIPGPDNRYRYCACGAFIEIAVQDMQAKEPYSCLMCGLKKLIEMMEAKAAEGDRHTVCICCQLSVAPEYYGRYTHLCLYCIRVCADNNNETCSKKNENQKAKE